MISQQRKLNSINDHGILRFPPKSFNGFVRWDDQTLLFLIYIMLRQSPFDVVTPVYVTEENIF